VPTRMPPSPGPAVPEQDLDDARPLAPEGEQMARECVLLQRVLNRHRKPIHALPHVGLAQRQVHLHAGRNYHHRVGLPLSDVPAHYVRIAPFRCEHASTIWQINRCHASRQWQHVQSECRWMGWFRFVGRLFTRQHDWRQFCFRFSAIPKLGAPAEQSTRGKSVRAGDNRDAVPGLFTFQHDGELLFAPEAAPIGTSIAC
jgi:hypothetical protein